MTELTFPLPEIGEASIAADPRTLEALINIKAWAAGQIDATNIKANGVETATIKNEAITEAKLSSAVAALLNAKSSGLTVATTSSNQTAASGELWIMEGNGTTLKLPTATANRVVGAFCGTGATVIGVAATGADKIYGGTANGAATVDLTKLQHATFQANGAGAWLITAGEILNEQNYSAQAERTPGTSYEASATREAYVVLQWNGEGASASSITAEVAEVAIGTFGYISGGQPSSLGFPVLPGKKYRGTKAGAGAGKLFASVLLK